MLVVLYNSMLPVVDWALTLVVELISMALTLPIPLALESSMVPAEMLFAAPLASVSAPPVEAMFATPPGAEIAPKGKLLGLDR
jgi:hypothetical protein